MPAFSTVAAALAPTAIKLGANFLREDKPSKYEKSLSSLADIYEKQADAPLDQNRTFKEGKRQLDRADEKNRESIQNSSATTGATDEARLASMENNNEAYGAALSRLFNTAERYRSRMRSRYLNTIARKEQAGQARDARFQRDLNNVIQPFSKASSTFLMSKLFDKPGTESDPTDDTGYDYASDFMFNNKNAKAGTLA